MPDGGTSEPRSDARPGRRRRRPPHPVVATPIWNDTFPRPAALRSAPVPALVDVAIVGGGYTGLAAARVLARAGADVAVLEAERIGFGASASNGGIAAAATALPLATLVRRYGMDRARAFWDLSLEALDVIGDIVDQEGIDCDFQRTGGLRLAQSARHFDDLRAKAVMLRRLFGQQTELLSRGDLGACIGSERFHGALLEHESGSLHPTRLLYGLAMAAARQGALVCEEAKVTAVERAGHHWQLRTSRGDVRAETVLVATNGYSEDLLPELRRRLFPAGAYVIATEPLDPGLAEQLLPRPRVCSVTPNGVYQFRLGPDRRLLFIGRNGLRLGVGPLQSAERLRRAMVAIFPALEPVAVTHSWSGQLGYTFDRMPHAGTVQGVHYALGFCGHGVPTATWLGTAMGHYLAGTGPATPFHRLRPQCRFYHRRSWFVPLISVYSRLADLIR